MTDKKKTCGDFGGETAAGEPCTRPAGWGKDRDTGRCKAHSKAKESKDQEIKKDFVKALKEKVRSVKKAANIAGVDQSTIWKWRQRDEEFDKKVIEAKDTQDELRADQLEDSVFKDAVKGDATGSERIFLLKCLRPEKYKDKSKVEVNQYNQQSTKVAQKTELSILEQIRKSYEKHKEDESKPKAKKRN